MPWGHGGSGVGRPRQDTHDRRGGCEDRAHCIGHDDEHHHRRMLGARRRRLVVVSDGHYGEVVEEREEDDIERVESLIVREGDNAKEGHHLDG